MTIHRIFDWTPQAVVFDCDGTLVDSERHWQQARDIVLRENGAEPDPEFTESSKGLHYTECGALMADLIGTPEHSEEITRQLLTAFRGLVAQAPAAMPGAPGLVTALSRRVPLAVASNCPADVVEFSLQSVGLRQHIRHIVVPGPGVAPKPDPDTYAEAVRLLGAERGGTLAVEDSLNGLRSAVAAGLRVIGVGRAPGPEALALADLWVDTLEDRQLTAWATGRPPGRRTESGTTATAPVRPTVPRQGSRTQSRTSR
ncbi:HAD family hydrolase [Streptomyces sp. NPDC052040]|uniref:HAD family hydrolase n=1 Tax=unclassified Streptomyces TaxID=2593676 RepID=UPI0037D2D608